MDSVLKNILGVSSDMLGDISRLFLRDANGVQTRQICERMLRSGRLRGYEEDALRDVLERIDALGKEAAEARN